MDEQRELMETLDGYIAKLINGISEAAHCLQGGDESKGVEIIVEIIDGLQWTFKAIEKVNSSLKEHINISEINDKLIETVQAFENKDYILISDLFEYEIAPILNEWKNKVEASL